jgi:hypothetical protein
MRALQAGHHAPPFSISEGDNASFFSGIGPHAMIT